MEGQNLRVEWRMFGQHFDLLPQYAQELVRARADAIVAVGDEAIRAAQEVTKTIPIVAITDDLLGSDLVNSMARPDGNTTGISILAREVDSKRLDILIEAVPGLRRMAVLTDVNDTTNRRIEALREVTARHNIEFSIYHVTDGEEIVAALDSARASGASALSILSSPLFYGYRHLIIERAAATRLPTIYEFPETAEERRLCGLWTAR
jgi:putative ABC transport system substrate-binding protein